MNPINPLDYYSEYQWKLIKDELDSHPSPGLVIDLAIIEKSFKDLKTYFPYAKVYYAVKTNPLKEAMTHLLSLGTNFDVASKFELDEVLKSGATPDRVSYGNTIKKREDIKYAYDKGCRIFATDSPEDLKNLADYAPGSDVFFRIILEGDEENADWPLTFKFGAKEEVIAELIPLSKKLGLNPRGISFHVGSQQNDPYAWCLALEKVSNVFKTVKEKYGIELDLINLGGGLPANYIKKHKTIKEYAEIINGCLNDYFPEGIPSTIIMEPGRSLFGNSGVMKTSVVLISEKEKDAEEKWLYVDAGLYNGLSETQGECIKYPLYTEVNGTLTDKFIIAGPTCDSMDVMYKNFRNPLPENIQIDDSIYWLSCGAYGISSSSVGFNGYPPMETYVVNSNEVKTVKSSTGFNLFNSKKSFSAIFTGVSVLALIVLIVLWLFNRKRLPKQQAKKYAKNMEATDKGSELIEVETNLE